MPRVTVFGWKRNKELSHLKLCEELCYELVKNHNCNIATGAGSGFMSAANKGAFDANPNKSIGFGVKLLEEQINEYILEQNLFICEDFPVRMSMLINTSDYIIVMKGSTGTLHELYMALDGMKTNHIDNRPIICVGVQFWTTLREWHHSNGIDFPDKYISLITDDKNEIIDFIAKNEIKKTL